MPLTKKKESGNNLDMAATKIDTKTDDTMHYEKPMTKDDYWRRREERDVEREGHIRRAGAWQAAIQSQGILSFANVQNLDDYLVKVEEAAKRGVRFVEGI